MALPGNTNRKKNVSRPRAWRKDLVVLLLLIGMGAVGYWGGTVTHGMIDDNQGLRIPEDNLDFGEVWATDGFEWVVPLKNEGKRRVDILGFESSCSCTAIEPQSFGLDVGEVKQLKLTLDLTKKEQTQRGMSAADFRVRIVPRIRDGMAGERGWPIHGRVRVPFEISPSHLSFWEGVTKGIPSRKKRVLVTSRLGLNELTTREKTGNVEIVSRKLTDNPTTYELQVGVTPATSPGPFSFDVFLGGVMPDGAKLPERVLKVKGVVESKIRPLPANVFFGTRAIGGRAEEVVAFLASSSKRLELVKVETQGDGLFATFEERKLHATVEATNRMRITQRCVKQGLQRNSVNVWVREEGAKEAEKVMVAVSYYGLTEK